MVLTPTTVHTDIDETWRAALDPHNSAKLQLRLSTTVIYTLYDPTQIVA